MDGKEIKYEQEIISLKETIEEFFNSINSKLFDDASIEEKKQDYKKIVDYFDARYKPLIVNNISLVLTGEDKRYYENLLEYKEKINGFIVINKTYNNMDSLLNMAIDKGNTLNFMDNVFGFLDIMEVEKTNLSVDMKGVFEKKLFELLYKVIETEISNNNDKKYYKAILERLTESEKEKLKKLAIEKLEYYSEIFTNDEDIIAMKRNILLDKEDILFDIANITSKIYSDNLKFREAILEMDHFDYIDSIRGLKYVVFDEELINNIFNKRYFDGGRITLLYKEYSKNFNDENYNLFLEKFIKNTMEDNSKKDPYNSFQSILPLIEERIENITPNNIESLKETIYNKNADILYVMRSYELMNNKISDEEFNKIIVSSLSKLNSSPFVSDFFELITNNSSRKVEPETIEELKNTAINFERIHNINSFIGGFSEFISQDDLNKLYKTMLTRTKDHNYPLLIKEIYDERGQQFDPEVREMYEKDLSKFNFNRSK